MLHKYFSKFSEKQRKVVHILWSFVCLMLCAWRTILCMITSSNILMVSPLTSHLSHTSTSLSRGRRNIRRIIHLLDYHFNNSIYHNIWWVCFDFFVFFAKARLQRRMRRRRLYSSSKQTPRIEAPWIGSDEITHLCLIEFVSVRVWGEEVKVENCTVSAL